MDRCFLLLTQGNNHFYKPFHVAVHIFTYKGFSPEIIGFAEYLQDWVLDLGAQCIPYMEGCIPFMEGTEL